MKNQQKLSELMARHDALLRLPNNPSEHHNGIYQRWLNPIVTAEHVPLSWRYDFNPVTNPMLLERIGVNATFNSGALLKDGQYHLVVRVEGNDRKSYFAVAQSPNGVDNFRFWDYPISLPETDIPDTNVYDMRLVAHQDGYIYGLFCTERKDLEQPDDLSAAVAQCGTNRRN